MTQDAIDIDDLKGWIGAERRSEDIITPRLAASLAAVLDLDLDDVGGVGGGGAEPGAPAPIGIHWCLCPEIAPMSGLGPDGHPARGDFLPPVPFPRRMWAGGELRFSGAFRVGDPVVRRSRIRDVSLKQGRSGALCFVTVDHAYETPRGVALEERHDIVYRPLDGGGQGDGKSPAAAAAPKPGPEAEKSFSVTAGPVLLARYSAVTFNGHRIHYDRAYCQAEEGYPGLVVHGPLQATFLLLQAQRVLGQAPARFTFRGLAPLFDGGAFSVNARRGDAPTLPLELWVADAAGRRTMVAEAAATAF